MVTNRKISGKAATLPGGVGIGAVTALGWTLVGSAVLAKLIELEKLPETAVGYGAMVILLTASFLGAVIAYHKVKKHRAQVSLLTGAAYYLTLLAMTALFFDGQYTGMGVTALVILAGSGGAVLLGLQKGSGGSRRSYTKASRKIVQSDHR